MSKQALQNWKTIRRFQKRNYTSQCVLSSFTLLYTKIRSTVIRFARNDRTILKVLLESWSDEFMMISIILRHRNRAFQWKRNYVEEENQNKTTSYHHRIVDTRSFFFLSEYVDAHIPKSDMNKLKIISVWDVSVAYGNENSVRQQSSEN